MIRCLRQWKKYTELQCWKSEQNEIALDKYRKCCVVKYFNLWKNKVCRLI